MFTLEQVVPRKFSIKNDGGTLVAMVEPKNGGWILRGKKMRKNFPHPRFMEGTTFRYFHTVQELRDWVIGDEPGIYFSREVNIHA